MMRTVRAERTTTEYANIEVEIDLADFAAEGYADATDDALGLLFIEAHRDYPENIDPKLSRMRWSATAELLHACS